MHSESPPPLSIDAETAQNEPAVEKRIDLVQVQVQREADVLARIAQTIPSNVATSATVCWR